MTRGSACTLASGPSARTDPSWSTVTVLDEGAVLAEGPLAAVKANPKVIEVYLGR